MKVTEFLQELSESTVRSAATRKGLKLQKARGDIAHYHGPNLHYRVLDRNTNFVVCGGQINGYGCSLEECADFIASY